jgi:tetratricopeptide (TPR) repeat protein
MLFALSAGLWRVVLGLALGLAPWAAPLDPPGPTSPEAAALRLIGAAAALGAILLLLGRSSRRQGAAALAGWAALTAALLAAAAFTEGSGPLGRAAWPLAPLVWPAALLLAAEEAGQRGRRLLGVAALGLAAALGSLAAAAPRVASQEAMWRTILLSDPGHDAAATGLARQLAARGQEAESGQVLAACVGAPFPGCGCTLEAAARLIDRSAAGQALGLIDAAPTGCAAGPAARGLRAEALAFLGQIDRARAEAREQEEDPADPHALLALAYAAHLAGDQEAAATLAGQAAGRGRGATAQLVLGLVWMKKGDLERARAAFSAATAAAPTSTAATYNLALVAQKQGRYRDAREGYLRVLTALDANHFEARYNLVILTREAGATLESQHHLARLRAAHPTDPRLAALGAPPAPRP